MLTDVLVNILTLSLIIGFFYSFFFHSFLLLQQCILLPPPPSHFFFSFQFSFSLFHFFLDSNKTILILLLIIIPCVGLHEFCLRKKEVIYVHAFPLMAVYVHMVKYASWFK